MELKIYRKPLPGERDSRIFHWVASNDSSEGSLDLAYDLVEIAIGGIEDVHLKRSHRHDWVSMREEVKRASLESGDSFDLLWIQSIIELLHEAIGSNLEPTQVYE